MRDQTMEEMVVQDLSQQIAAISVDRAAWKARALMAEKKLREAAEQDEGGEVIDFPSKAEETEEDSE